MTLEEAMTNRKRVLKALRAAPKEGMTVGEIIGQDRAGKLDHSSVHLALEGLRYRGAVDRVNFDSFAKPRYALADR